MPFQRADCKLTDQKAKIEKGKSPMPIYSSIHVKNDTSAKTFHGNTWLCLHCYQCLSYGALGMTVIDLIGALGATHFQNGGKYL